MKVIINYTVADFAANLMYKKFIITGRKNSFSENMDDNMAIYKSERRNNLG